MTSNEGLPPGYAEELITKTIKHCREEQRAKQSRALVPVLEAARLLANNSKCNLFAVVRLLQKAIKEID
jgi:hypothetical protein